jgi:hypothetical protein
VKLVFRIKVDVANPQDELKPGMPADVVLPPHSKLRGFFSRLLRPVMPSPAIKAQGLRRAFGELVAVAGLDLEVPRARSSVSSVPMAPARPRRCACSRASCRPPRARRGRRFDVVRDSEGLKEHIGYMSQRFGLYPDLTVIENIDFYADIYGVPARAAAAAPSACSASATSRRSSSASPAISPAA